MEEHKIVALVVWIIAELVQESAVEHMEMVNQTYKERYRVFISWRFTMQMFRFIRLLAVWHTRQK